MWMWNFECAIVNGFELSYDNDWIFTNMDKKIDNSKFYTWGLKSVH